MQMNTESTKPHIGVQDDIDFYIENKLYRDYINNHLVELQDR